MKVSWVDYSQYMEKCSKMFQTTNQVKWWFTIAIVML